VKKILGELENMKKNERDKYNTFYKEFGIPVKEGLYQDYENREKLLELAMFKSTKAGEFTTLDEYVERFEPDQNAIYYITGGKEEALKNSPLLEMYRNKNIEVLIMDDEIDEIVISSIPKYKDYDMKSVNRTDSAEDLKTEADKEKEKEVKPLIEKIKKVLGDKVKDVKASTRLSDSPSCIVADENDPTVQMQHIMKAMGQDAMQEFKPVLEINPEHEIVRKLMDASDESLVSDISFLLLEEAMLIEGVEIKSTADFVKRLNRVMGKAI
jgi:molecular chaperone HtpG